MRYVVTHLFSESTGGGLDNKLHGSDLTVLGVGTSVGEGQPPPKILPTIKFLVSPYYVIERDRIESWSAEYKYANTNHYSGDIYILYQTTFMII